MPSSISRSIASSTRRLRNTPARPCGFGDARVAALRSRNGSPRSQGSSICWYDQLWSAEWVQQEFESDYKDFIFRTILDGLSRRTTTGRRLLDIGAHAGRFMYLAKSVGWQPEGIELNPRTATFASTRTGLPVHAVNVDRLRLSNGSYGAITLIDVLEHVPEPLSLLSRVDDALEAGGWVAVKVPSGPAQRLKERVRARVHRGYRPRLADNLVHVNHFSPAALAAALERVGLRRISVDIAPPELPAVHDYRGVISNMFRRSLYHGGRRLPHGVNTPLALNLLAFRTETSVSSEHAPAPVALSVVIPTFNNETILRRAIDSWHTFAETSSIEVIVVEDGCRDGTRSVSLKSQTPHGAGSISGGFTWTMRTSCGVRMRGFASPEAHC